MREIVLAKLENIKTPLIKFLGAVTSNATMHKAFTGVRVKVRFTRRYGFYLLTLYIPTVLLITTAYFTLYYDTKDFNSRIVVALTALLVLSSLYTQVFLIKFVGLI